MNGSGLLLFTKRRLLDHMKEITLSKIGANNKLNNGSIALRFKIDDTSFAVVSTQL
jgi:hypothetical protein